MAEGRKLRLTMIRRIAVLIAAMAAFSSKVPADDEPAEDAARSARLERMKSLIDETTIETTDDTPRSLKRTEHALVRYTNPATSRFGDGALFLWLDGPRPAAAVSLSFRNEGQIYWELTSLSDRPLRLRRQEQAVWQPKSCSRGSERIAIAQPPAASPTARLVQMRNLARQFTLRENRRDQWQDGRLLTQPLYRWEDPQAGIVDGALFSFAETTDPELLLLLEARSSAAKGDAAWHYALAKMTSSACEVRLGDELVWSRPNYWKNPHSAEDAYIEARIAKYDLEAPTP